MVGDDDARPTGSSAAAGEADEVCKRRTYSLYDEDLVRLSRLEDRFGKPASEIFRLGLMAIEGNMRILRHAQAQPVNALKMLAHLVKLRARDEEELEIYQGLASVVKELEEMLAPLDREQPGA
jgi:hypothetical protein